MLDEELVPNRLAVTVETVIVSGPGLKNRCSGQVWGLRKSESILQFSLKTLACMPVGLVTLIRHAALSICNAMSCVSFRCISMCMTIGYRRCCHDNMILATVHACIEAMWGPWPDTLYVPLCVCFKS